MLKGQVTNGKWGQLLTLDIFLRKYEDGLRILKAVNETHPRKQDIRDMASALCGTGCGARLQDELFLCLLKQHKILFPCHTRCFHVVFDNVNVYLVVLGDDNRSFCTRKMQNMMRPFLTLILTAKHLEYF